MKTRTVTVVEGERLGPVDWGYDFHSHGWDREGSFNPKLVAGRVELLRALEHALARGEAWEATTYGGQPRCGWCRVLDVGMWDGWPYWRPVPSVLLDGDGWSSFLEVTEAREAPA